MLVSSPADWQLRKIYQLAPEIELGFDPLAYLEWLPEEPENPRIEPPFRKGIHGYWDDHFSAYYPGLSTSQYLADRCEMLIRLVPNVKVFYLRYHLLLQSLKDGFNWVEALHCEDILCDAWILEHQIFRQKLKYY